MNFFGWIFMFICLTVQCLTDGQKIKNRPIGTIFFDEIDMWSKCSTTCGEGFQEKLQACFKQTPYMIENIPIEKCKILPELKARTKSCNYGECTSGYVWKFNDWNKCSQTCGYEGIQIREVECFQISGQAVDQEMCEENKKPRTLRGCGRYNCPPSFHAKNWNACVKTSECLPGRQIRSLNCLALLNTGEVINLPRAACYRKGIIPPANWRQCFDHIDPKICFQKTEYRPEIISEKRVLVQMRRVVKLNLQIGQISYVFPGTKLTISCPTKNFLSSHLIWSHKLLDYSYKGKSTNRIRVTRKGKLIIKSFLIQDQGEWICRAGNISEIIVIKLKSPSDGYKDWAIRNTLVNKGMSDEMMQQNMMQQNDIRWIIGDWSQCSVSCENIGLQSRMVHCENLQKRFYFQLDDEDCAKKFGQKPLAQRECNRKFPCPIWNFQSLNTNQCTENCLDYEKAKMPGDLKCIFQNQSIALNKCNPTSKPQIECYNPDCKVTWKISNWTKCSRSCGKTGIQARYLICIWIKSELPAGDLCYKMNLEVPQVIKTCNPPKCNLGCIDMYPYCKNRNWYCKIALYSYSCCKTCQAYFKSVQRTNK